MDQEVLEDTNNPTMHNPACTACHERLDPVAGAFQNYGDKGLYRDQDGGLDALDRFYKYEPSGGTDIQVDLRSREEAAIELGTVRLFADQENELGVKNLRTFEGDIKLHLGLGEVVVLDLNENIVHRYEIRDVAEEEDCGGLIDEGYQLWDCGELLVLPLAVPADGDYTVQIEAWVLEQGEKAATMQVWMPGPFYRNGDTWYRDMRALGFVDSADPLVPEEDAHRSLQWLAQRIVEDERFAEAAVKFWWPSIMGSEVLEPSEDEDDADFEAHEQAANAQGYEVRRLADGFRGGFLWSGRAPYNLKDLLAEIATSKWFRAQAVTQFDGIGIETLRHAGAKRLLTPEELARKTGALTGFLWGRRANYDVPPRYEHEDALTGEYRLLFGGIDSNGITERARELSSVMAGVAASHAAESSCPIVLREFYLLPEEERLLFEGIDEKVSPAFETSATFPIEASSWADRETLRVASHLVKGTNTVAFRSTNYVRDEDTGDERHARLDYVEVTDATDSLIVRVELEDLDISDQGCSAPHHNEATGERDHILLWGRCRLAVPVEAPADGNYVVKIVAWADQLGDELAELSVVVESDTTGSAGAMAIRSKLGDLYARLFGLEDFTNSEEVNLAYSLFVDVWERKRELPNTSFFEPLICDYWEDHRYFDRILKDAIVENESERRYEWNHEKVRAFVHEQINPRDHNGVARTWVVILAYLLMEYRYLYL